MQESDWSAEELPTRLDKLAPKQWHVKTSCARTNYYEVPATSD